MAQDRLGSTVSVSPDCLDPNQLAPVLPIVIRAPCGLPDQREKRELLGSLKTIRTKMNIASKESATGSSSMKSNFRD